MRLGAKLAHSLDGSKLEQAHPALITRERLRNSLRFISYPLVEHRLSASRQVRPQALLSKALLLFMAAPFPISITAPAEAAGVRLDQFLVGHLPDVSRARIQRSIEQRQILVEGQMVKASMKLRGGEQIQVLGPPQAEPLRAVPEEIPLDIVYEDDDLGVINKPAGMMVHAGAGATEDERNRGTLVNALLHRFRRLSQVGGGLRPGIVHRLDR